LIHAANIIKSCKHVKLFICFSISTQKCEKKEKYELKAYHLLPLRSIFLSGQSIEVFVY
jgi:hypothetical protein